MSNLPRTWMDFSVIARREDLAILCNDRDLVRNAAEIGVHRGAFASRFISKWKGQMYHAVDPWETGLADYVDGQITPERDRVRDYDEFVRVTDSHNQRITAHFCTSTIAAHRLQHLRFSFVYIDADHRFHKVVDDIESWYPLVEEGGVLAGHDVINGSFVEVADALEYALVINRGYKRIEVIPGDAWSWYIVKGTKD